MGWPKKKSNIIESPHDDLVTLASRLGCERRLQVRISCPDTNLSYIPRVEYNSKTIVIRDISIGGCCLHDPKEILGPKIGHEVELTLHWGATQEKVKSRIVGRVDHRRHIQFLDLPPTRRELLRSVMTPGVRALGVRSNLTPIAGGGPTLDVVEMWSSISGDCVVLEDHVHRVAQLSIQGSDFYLFREARPVHSNNQAVSAREFEDIILFLVNIPNPSPALKGLCQLLLALIRERP